MDELKIKIEGKFNELLKSYEDEIEKVREDNSLRPQQRIDAEQRIRYNIFCTKRAMSAVMSVFDEFNLN